MISFRQHLHHSAIPTLITGFLILLFTVANVAQSAPEESDHYRIKDVPTPEDAMLEVGGLATLPDGTLAIATRRGNVYLVEVPTGSEPHFRKFASGLHEILGLTFKDGVLYCAQRGELTGLEDNDGDGRADVYRTIYAWPLSGHYHEYSFGPVVGPDGSFFVSGNVSFGKRGWWDGGSRVPWRGWMMKISEDGRMQPWATGMRSPAGLETYDRELFYTENQGDWIGSGGIWHVEKGSFTGHPAGLRWSDRPESPVSVTKDDIYDVVDPRLKKDDRGNWIKPENRRGEDWTAFYELQEKHPDIQPPAVWLPHGILGISTSDPIVVPGDTFTSFEGQLLIGDQGQSKISRVFMEKVKGVYQGAAVEFRSGFQSGVMRMAWAEDGSLFVGETNRGWGSAGSEKYGLERVVPTGKTPFEIQRMEAKPDGFRLTFTRPVDRESARDLASYSMSSFIYKYHPVYGSPMVGQESCPIKGVRVSDDGRSARIIVDNLRPYYVHHLILEGIRSKENGEPLLHQELFYTLNRIPEGPTLSMDEVSTLDTSEETSGSDKDSDAEGAPSYEDIKPLLSRHTCTSCHSKDKRKIGPPFSRIAEREYSRERIVELIYNPEEDNWPDYKTGMPPMTGVPEEEALKIAEWINSLNE